MTVQQTKDLSHSLSVAQIVRAATYYSALQSPSRTVETSYGRVEYAEEGVGPAVLVFHGGPGGFDQALAVGKLFSQNGYRVIAPSRPGYLRTALRQPASIADQAHFAATLLDALEIDSVIIVGTSAGGMGAYSFAQLYPQRTRALIAIDGLCLHYTKDEEVGALGKWLYLSKPGLWLGNFFMQHFPEAAVASFLKTESSLSKHEIGQRAKEVVRDPDRFALLDVLYATMMQQYEQRKAGVDCDLLLSHRIDKLSLDRISCPTLIIEGSADGDVLPEHAEYAHNSIPQSELLWVDSGSHIGFWTAPDAYKVQRYTLDWLARQKLSA